MTFQAPKGTFQMYPQKQNHSFLKNASSIIVLLLVTGSTEYDYV
jgi:hypothetical protein